MDGHQFIVRMIPVGLVAKLAHVVHLVVGVGSTAEAELVGVHHVPASLVLRRAFRQKL